MNNVILKFFFGLIVLIKISFSINNGKIVSLLKN